MNALLNFTEQRRYLEIGVEHGSTFLGVKAEHKVGIDTSFRFNITEYSNPATNFLQMESDSAFEVINQEDFGYDVIFIDGLHTFEQTYRDFLNALEVLEPNGFIVIDDVWPNDRYSYIADQKVAYELRARSLNGAPLSDYSWHGDVFKVIAIIHDFHQHIEYRTFWDNGNPQSVLWYSDYQKRETRFSNLHEISTLPYEDLLVNMDILFNRSEEEILNEIENLSSHNRECLVTSSNSKLSESKPQSDDMTMKIGRRTEPLLSLITPTRDREKELIAQYVRISKFQYTNWEWLIFDDSIGDLQIFREIKDERIKIVHIEQSEGKSIGEKRNKLIDMAKGSFIVHIDDDDLYQPSYLGEMLQGLESNSSDIFYLETFLAKDAKKQIWEYSSSVKLPEIEAWGFTYIYKTEIALQHPFPKNNWEDHFWFKDILANGCRYAFGQDKTGELVTKVIHDSNTSKFPWHLSRKI